MAFKRDYKVLKKHQLDSKQIIIKCERNQHIKERYERGMHLFEPAHEAV